MTYSQWRRYRRTLNELNAKSNRELHDMGIARWRVPEVAKGRAFDRREVL